MSNPKTFRPWNPEQTLLLPPSAVEWLPEHHLVFFLLDLATELPAAASRRCLAGWIMQWGGLRQFKLRGRGKVSAVFGLHVIAYNLI